MGSAHAAAEYDRRIEACPLCGSHALRPYDRDASGATIDACGGCGIKFMNPQYTDADRVRFYAHFLDFGLLDAPETSLPMRKRKSVRVEGKRRSLELVGRYVAPGRVLSVGCGDGIELSVAQELGWTAEGYDVDPDATARVASRYGALVHTGDFRDLPLRTAPFDAVVMDQVIEHLKNPGEYLRTIASLLRPGGVLFLGAPNVGSLSNRAKTALGKLGLRGAKRGKHYACDHHVVYLAPTPLRRVLEERHGFDVLRVGGSLKPQKKRASPVLSRWFPSVDSSFYVLARRRKDV